MRGGKQSQSSTTAIDLMCCCPHAAAHVLVHGCNSLCRRVKGKGVDEVLTIKNSDIAKHLSLPPVKLHCSMLAEDAIKARDSSACPRAVALQRVLGASLFSRLAPAVAWLLCEGPLPLPPAGLAASRHARSHKLHLCNGWPAPHQPFTTPAPPSIIQAAVKDWKAKQQKAGGSQQQQSAAATA